MNYCPLSLDFISGFEMEFRRVAPMRHAARMYGLGDRRTGASDFMTMYCAGQEL
jgi:hypothetical protein